MTTKIIHFVFVLKTLFVLSLLFMNVNSHAQGVAINNLGNNPDNSAILDVSSTEKGFLIPRLTTTERDAISAPASSLLIYNSTTKCFEFYENGGWQSLGCACIDPPTQPSAITGNDTPCENQTGLSYSVTFVQGVTYTWNLPSGWIQTAGGSTNSITVTAGTSSGVISVTPSNACGSGTAQTLVVTTTPEMIAGAPSSTPTVCNNTAISPNITHATTGATGIGTATGLPNGVTATWSSNEITISGTPNELGTFNYSIPLTGGCGSINATGTITVNFCCGSPLTINHIIGDVAPETKTVTYGTVLSTLGGTGAKCWITQNLGASNEASSATDATDGSAGWYWQFNRKQGYKVGPSPTWTITSISESSDWIAANDPCTIELGTGWRIPNYTEWFNADATGGWGNYTHTYASVFKLHAAGYLLNTNGSLSDRGNRGYYWSSTNYNNTNGYFLDIRSTLSSMQPRTKSHGLSIRCIKD